MMIDASNYKFLKELERRASGFGFRFRTGLKYTVYKYEQTLDFMNSTTNSFPDLCEMLYEKSDVVASVWKHKDINDLDVIELQFLTYGSDGILSNDVLLFNKRIDEHRFSFVTLPVEQKTSNTIADQFIQHISSRTMFDWDWLGEDGMGRPLFTLPSANSVAEMKMKIQLIGDANEKHTI